MDGDDRDELSRRLRATGPRGGRTLAVSDDPEAARRAIEDLDLDRVRECGATTYGWPYPAQAIRRYRDFLWVCWNHDKRARSLAAISLLADKLWHCHMLLPAKYLEDCERIFGRGYVLDHTPVLPGGRAVSELDEALAAAEYAKLGVPLPADIQTRCIWAAVEPRPRAQERA